MLSQKENLKWKIYMYVLANGRKLPWKPGGWSPKMQRHNGWLHNTKILWQFSNHSKHAAFICVSVHLVLFSFLSPHSPFHLGTWESFYMLLWVITCLTLLDWIKYFIFCITNVGRSIVFENVFKQHNHNVQQHINELICSLSAVKNFILHLHVHLWLCLMSCKMDCFFSCVIFAI